MKKNLLLFLLMLLSLIVLSCQDKSAKKAGTMIAKTSYGKLPDGREVSQYTLKNAGGVEVRIINYGAIVTSIRVPDHDGKLADIVLGYDSLSGYLGDNAFLGAIVGRYGNRINKGRFKIDGQEYQVTVNDGENHLHGGKIGFNKVLWDAKVGPPAAEPALALTYISPDGEEGYPGTVTLTVTYTLTNENELRIDYEGKTDKPTILNPTHHSYFNLTGNPIETILNHELIIDADKITPVDAGLIPTGELADVANTPFDFRKPQKIGLRINEPNEQLQFGHGYDHNWVLNNYDRTVHEVVELYEPLSGRLMEVFTDQPGMQFYSGNFLNGTIRGKNGVQYQHRTGLCLEAQCFPDSPNKPNFPSVILRPGQVYHQRTIYKFSVK
jgi:aldose 1-epimerase